MTFDSYDSYGPRTMTVLVLKMGGLDHGSFPETSTPDVIGQCLSGFIASMLAQVKHYGGVCGSIEADRITAFWGLDEGGGDPVKACECALACKGEISELSERWSPEHPDALYLHAGISTGHGIVVPYGDRKEPSYTAYGDTVKMADIFARKNREHDTNIIVSESVAKFIDGRFSVRFLDQIPLKGEIEPVKLFQLES